MVVKMTSSLFFYTFLFGILTSLNTFALDTSSSKTHVVHASSKDSAVRLSFISLKDKPAIACSFLLYYKKVLFNNNGSEVFSAKYSKDKHLRSQILAETLFGYFVVSLQIQNINPLDAGVYRCNLSCGQNIVQYIYLKVYYPPSAANCTWEVEQRVPLEMVKFLDYSILQCTATRGYPEGGIICYSQLQDKTLAHSPYHISGHQIITATFWLRKESPLNCCSVNEHLIKVEEVCDDFVSYTKVSTKVTYTHKDKFLSKARSDIQVDILSLTPPTTQTVNPNLKDSISSRSGNFTSNVAIESVQREDTGTYICQSDHTDDDESNNYFFRLGVNVIYQPGKAICNVDTPPEDTESGWLALRCTAEAGYYLGKFECYQNGILVPPWKKPTQRGDTLKQSMWIQKAYPVFCCATAYKKHKSLCECNDFKWDPILGNATKDTIDPCSVTTISAGINTEPKNDTNLSPTITTKEKESVTDGIISEENTKTNISEIEIIYKKFVWQTFIITFLSLVVLAVLFNVIIWRCKSERYGSKKTKGLSYMKCVSYSLQRRENKEGLPSGTQPTDDIVTVTDTENINVLCEDSKQESLYSATGNKHMHKSFQVLEKPKKGHMRKRNLTDSN